MLRFSINTLESIQRFKPQSLCLLLTIGILLQMDP